jgi:hypothetical protein
MEKAVADHEPHARREARVAAAGANNKSPPTP